MLGEGKLEPLGNRKKELVGNKVRVSWKLEINSETMSSKT